MENKVKTLIKGLFEKHNVDPKEVFADVQLAEEVLEDDTVIGTEGEFEVGSPVMIKTEDGEMVVPEGTHKLKDGTPFEVDANSIVIAWGEKEEAEEEEEEKEEAEKEEEEMSAPLTEEKVESMIKEAVSTMLEEFSKIQSETLAEATKKAEDAESKAENLSKELEEHLSKASAEKSTKPQKVVVQKSVNEMSKKERMMYAFNSRKK